AGGLTGRSVAQVEGDAAILVAELLYGIERWVVAGDTCDVRVQPAARDQQKRESGTGFLIVNANTALSQNAHADPPPALLTPWPALQSCPASWCRNRSHRGARATGSRDRLKRG